MGVHSPLIQRIGDCGIYAVFGFRIMCKGTVLTNAKGSAIIKTAWTISDQTKMTSHALVFRMHFHGAVASRPAIKIDVSALRALKETPKQTGASMSTSARVELAGRMRSAPIQWGDFNVLVQMGLRVTQLQLVLMWMNAKRLDVDQTLFAKTHQAAIVVAAKTTTTEQTPILRDVKTPTSAIQ
jgi:hypothetical protein